MFYPEELAIWVAPVSRSPWPPPPTFSQRIARGAIPLDEALPIAKQIADALEVAHEHPPRHDEQIEDQAPSIQPHEQLDDDSVLTRLL